MGIAAYNRTTTALRREFDESEKEQRFREIIDRINNYPKGSVVPLGDVVIEIPKKKGDAFWLLRSGKDRHSHFGYYYPDLKSLLAEWALTVTGFDRDENGMFYLTEKIT